MKYAKQVSKKISYIGVASAVPKCVHQDFMKYQVYRSEQHFLFMSMKNKKNNS